MFYVVRALSPYTEYEFYVIAVNNIGRGPPSIPATTTTGETGKTRRSWHIRLVRFRLLRVPSMAYTHMYGVRFLQIHPLAQSNILFFNWFI